MLQQARCIDLPTVQFFCSTFFCAETREGGEGGGLRYTGIHMHKTKNALKRFFFFFFFFCKRTSKSVILWFGVQKCYLSGKRDGFVKIYLNSSDSWLFRQNLQSPFCIIMEMCYGVISKALCSCMCTSAYESEWARPMKLSYWL